jgi:tetratricopeptide (TPR) repeat protein
MNDFATRLMAESKPAAGGLPTTILGSSLNLQQSIQVSTVPARIGFWPVVWTDKPEIAMALVVMLAALLERYRGVRVYRLMAAVEGVPESYAWSIAKSQFDVDEWQLDDLDDNVGIWGYIGPDWDLHLTVESDIKTVEGEQGTIELSYKAGSLPSLVAHLPKVAGEIAEFLGLYDLQSIAPLFQPEAWNEHALETCLKQVFQWDLKLYLAIWGQSWPLSQMRADYSALVAAAQPLGSLGAWLAAQALGRSLGLSDEIHNPTDIWALSDAANAAFARDPLFSALLANSARHVGLVDEAESLLVDIVNESDEPEAVIFLTLAEIYWQQGKVLASVDILQQAIEAEIDDLSVYSRYVDMLLTLALYQISPDKFVFIDPDEIDDDQVNWEVVEALEDAISLEPTNSELISKQLIQLAELGDAERLWSGFETLVRIDEDGEYLRGVIDHFHYLDHVDSAVRILSQALTARPDSVPLYLNLALVHILNENTVAAQKLLNRARQLADDRDTQEEIERLELLADDPEFEYTLGEINDIIDSGNELSASHVAFLEHVIEKVPTYAEIYVLLAKSYLKWKEIDAALEILLDGHKQVPNDPDIVALLSETFWNFGEKTLAFQYLSKGLSNHPGNPQLLSLAGLYLFEDDQFEAARLYLARAQAISPQDPVLKRVQHHIGRSLNT